MTIELPADLIESVRAEVLSGNYPNEDAMVAAVLREHLHRQAEQLPERTGESELDSTHHKPLWQEILDLQKSIPDEEWDKLPVDGSSQLDHYLTGAPKRPEL